MRVVLVSDSYVPVLGGIELHVRDLAAALTAHGHDVEVVTGTTAPCAPDPAARVHRLGHGRGGRRLAALLAGADVVHAHSSVVSPLTWRAVATARSLGVPALVTVHSMVPRGTAAPMVLALRSATARGLRWSAVSAAVAEPLSRWIGRPVSVLHNGIDPAPWRGAVPPHPDRNSFTVVSTLRFAARKRPAALVRAVAALQAGLPDVDVRAVFVGDGPLLPRTRRRLARAGLADRVELPGRLDRPGLREVLAGADAYLAPARLESFGLAALEARCTGLPVVAMASSGVGEFVRHDVEGLLAVDDAQAVAHLRALALDRGRRERIRHHNTTTTPDVTWDRVLAETLAEYGRAAQGRDLGFPGPPVLRSTGTDPAGTGPPGSAPGRPDAGEPGPGPEAGPGTRNDDAA